MKVIVIGAGPMGLYIASSLKGLGFDVAVYEQRHSLFEIDKNRSINLALSTRGLTALSKLGLDQQLVSQAVEMHGRVLHTKENEKTFQPYSHNKRNCLYSVNRQKLVELLFNKTISDCDTPVYLSATCLQIDVHRKIAYFRHHKKFQEVSYDFLIGCDGLHSVVRKFLQQESPEVEYWYKQISCGYKEVVIHQSIADRLHLDRHSLHIWPEGKGMFIALPNLDGSFTGTLFWPRHELQALDGKNQYHIFLQQAFFKHFEEDLVQHLSKELSHNPVGTLRTISFSPWYFQDHLLLGDSAHAIVPFYGQGVNAALEDGAIFCDQLKQTHFNWRQAAAHFSLTRKRDTDVLAKLALEHYIEMCSKVRSPFFRVFKKLKLLLGLFILTEYAIVSFSVKSYQSVLRRRKSQKLVLFLIFLLAAVVGGYYGIRQIP